MEHHITWISLPVVLAVHDQILDATGGLPGLSDIGLLQSALARPEQSAHYENPDIADLAALYAHGIAKNHAFADGNKRTALVVAVAFLELNGYELTLSEAEAVVVMLAIASGEVDEREAAKIFREHIKKL